jgi:Lambda phage tail tube protein, TTP
MSATQAVIGYLSQFFVGDSASPTTYTAMLEIKSIKPALYTVPAVDATHLLSPNATEEKLPGLIKPGTLSITGNFIGDATQLNISTLAQARTVFGWKITAPVQSGTKVWTVTALGFISRYDHDALEASKLHDVMFDIEVSGNILETVA